VIWGLDYASVDGNGTPDLGRAWPSGKLKMGFLYVRAAWGTYQDPDMATGRDLATKERIPFGAYLFLRYPELGHPAPSPEEQAGAFASALGDKRPGEMPPVVDIEFPGKRGRVDTGMTAAQALDWAVRAVSYLEARYGCVGVYTSERVWREDLGNAAAPLLAGCPLWVKTPYWRGPRQPADWDHTGDVPVPQPWHGAAWIQQFQGDAIGVPGFRGTVDLNRFLVATDNPVDPRHTWIAARLKGKATADFQRSVGLQADGVIGPRTFAALCEVSP
jgi:GH25 family lysozyme M1 (1,4-beta-N-acetylmuramidase)